MGVIERKRLPGHRRLPDIPAEFATMLKKIVCFACGMVFVATAARLAAQEAVLNEFYGSGVHQYFSGNMDQAIADLTASIRGGSKDPRAYYFRALAEMQRGMQQQAMADLQQGAALESADLNQFYPVGKSLERVQGSARLAIERYRAVARAQALDQQRKRAAVRYEQRRRAEAAVLRAAAPAAEAEAVKAAAAEPLPAKPAEEDPFADEKTPPTPDTEMPAEEAEPATEAPKPAAETSKPAAEAAKPAAEASKPAAEAPAADAPAAGPAAEDDPFADEK